MQKIDVRALIERHNHNKGYTPIPFDILWRMFKDSFRCVDNFSMDDRVWAGLMQTPEYRGVWDRLNDICLDCMKGRAGLKEYQDTLDIWGRMVGHTPVLGF